MADTNPRLSADERGVWRESIPGHPHGISWEDVYRISGHKLDGVIEVSTCIVLDFEYGEFIELYDCWPGFQQVVSEITRRLPGIGSDWLLHINRLSVDDSPLEVWRRSPASVAPDHDRR